MKTFKQIVKEEDEKFRKEFWKTVSNDTSLRDKFIDLLHQRDLAVRQQTLDEVREKIEQFLVEEYGYRKEKIEFIKPKHGVCCTCQTCGFPNDVDCVCQNNRIFNFLETLRNNK